MKPLINRRFVLGAGLSTASLPLVVRAQSEPIQLSVTEWLGRNWRDERVRFAVGQEAASLKHEAFGIVDSAGRSIPFEVLADGETIEILVDLPPFGRVDFEARAGSLKARTDLRVRTTSDLIILQNDLGKLAIRRRLSDGDGPIAGIDRGDGVWIGASRLVTPTDHVAFYEAVIERKGPVAATVVCRTRFRSGHSWELRATMQAADAAILVDEVWSQWSHAEVALDLAQNLEPTKVYFRKGAGDPGQANSVGAVALETIDGAIGASEFEVEPWLHWWISKRRGNWFAAIGDRTPGAVMIAALRADLWITEEDAQAGREIAPLRVVRSQGGLDLVLPRDGARRRWLVAMLPSTVIDASLVGKTGVLPPPQELVIKHGDFPLDWVKDEVLAWPTPGEPYARMMLGGDDLERLRSTPGVPGVGDKLGKRPLDEFSLGDFLQYYLRSGDEEIGKRISLQALSEMQGAVDLFLHQDRLVTMGMAPHWQRQILYAVHLADSAFADDFLTANQKARLRAQAAFLAYTVGRLDYWAPKRGFSANPNMTSMVAAYQGFLACLLWGHPSAQGWLDSSLGELMVTELLGWSDDQGGWLEAPHYAMGSFDFILGLAVCARNRGRPELFEHPRLRRVLEWFAKITTPPDPRLGNARHLPPIGNTYLLEASSEFGQGAYIWRDFDPGLSAQFQWMHRASGSPMQSVIGGAGPALDPYRSIFLDRSLPEHQPAYGSELFSRTGAVLRSHFGTDRETQLLIIAGSNHAHYDYDSGSITIWGKGRRIADDFGYTGRAPMSDHSMVDSPGDAAIMQIEAFKTTEFADYLIGRSGGWTRQIMFVKASDPLGPNYYVIRDRLDGGKNGIWRLWFAGQVSLEGSAATVIGEDDVDTHVSLFSNRPLATRLETISRTSVSGPVNKTAVTTQTAIVAAMAGNGCTITAVIYPHLKMDQRPQCSGNPDGSKLSVKSGGERDTIFFLGDVSNPGGGEAATPRSVGAVLHRREGVHSIMLVGPSFIGGGR